MNPVKKTASVAVVLLGFFTATVHANWSDSMSAGATSSATISSATTSNTETASAENFTYAATSPAVSSLPNSQPESFLLQAQNIVPAAAFSGAINLHGKPDSNSEAIEMATGERDPFRIFPTVKLIGWQVIHNYGDPLAKAKPAAGSQAHPAARFTLISLDRSDIDGKNGALAFAILSIFCAILCLRKNNVSPGTVAQ